jgi:outer membrane protein assembly factor BamB
MTSIDTRPAYGSGWRRVSRGLGWFAPMGACCCWIACGAGNGTTAVGGDGGGEAATGTMTDAGTDAGTTMDAGATDAGTTTEAGTTDAGTAADAGATRDAGPESGTRADAGQGLDSAADGAPGTVGGGPVNVLTNRYDNARSGANTSETVLTTANVNTTTFGFKFSADVVGRVYGQPLYVSGLTVGAALHNVVYVATEHNVVYAFDADNGTLLWSKTLEAPAILGEGTSFNPGCADMGSGAATYEVGITSTPVIDLTAQLIYVVAKKSGKQMLHALHLTTGADGPTPARVGPAGFSSDNVPLNRPGLLLLNGVVYVAFGSHCDAGDFHGWIFGHDAKSLALVSTYNTTPTGSDGAIWQGGVGLSSDGTGIWFSVANGTTGGDNMGMSVVRATPAGSTLTNGQHHSEPADGDNDLSAGAVLVGDQVLSGGKSGYVVLLNASDASQAQLVGAGGEVLNVATWDGGSAGQLVYTWATGAPLHAWQLAGGMLTAEETNNEVNPGHPGGTITISSNGTLAGSGVLWVLLPTSGDAWHSTAPGALYAFDASNVAKHSLWNSNLDATPLAPLGTYAKFSPPTVANGKVYAAAFPPTTAAAATGKLMVYGLK